MDAAQTVNNYIKTAHAYAGQGNYEAACVIMDQLLAAYKKDDVLLFHKGKILQKSGKFAEAKKAFEAAIKTQYKPSYVTALCEVLWALKEYKQVYQQIARAHLKDPTNYGVLFHELRFDLENSNYEAVIKKAENALAKSQYTEVETGVLNLYLALAYYMQPASSRLEECVQKMDPFVKDEKTKALPISEHSKQLQNYSNFITLLTAWKRNNPQIYIGSEKKIYLVSNSHSLSGAYVTTDNGYQIIPKLIWNARAYFMHQKSDSKENSGLRNSINSIPKGSKAIFQIGEIDCRPNGGFFKRWLRGDFDLDSEIENAVAEHIGYLKQVCEGRDLDIYFATVHAPNQNFVIKSLNESNSTQHAETYMHITQKFNDEIRKHVDEAHIIDVFAENHHKVGMGKLESFIDTVHLYPTVIKTAVEKKIS